MIDWQVLKADRGHLFAEGAMHTEDAPIQEGPDDVAPKAMRRVAAPRVVGAAPQPCLEIARRIASLLPKAAKR